MKTAVSIPNELFEGAERLARRTRSQIVSLDKSLLTERVSKLPRPKLELLFAGLIW
jgi:hypothetical protein